MADTPATITIPCPECNKTEDLGVFVSVDGVAELDLPGFLIVDGHLRYTHTGHTHHFDHQQTIGVVCGGCGWTYEGADWEDYLLNYEKREKERIHQEFLREAGLLGDSDEDDAPDALTEWSVPLVSGEIQIVIPVTKNGKQTRPIIITADMNTMEEVQNIQIDPKARTVQMVTKDELSFVEFPD